MPYVCYLRYETLSAQPDLVLRKLALQFGLTLHQAFYRAVDDYWLCGRRQGKFETRTKNPEWTQDEQMWIATQREQPDEEDMQRLCRITDSFLACVPDNVLRILYSYI